MIVLPMHLLNDGKKKFEPPVQKCCNLRVKEGCLLYCNISTIFRNSSRLDLTPPPKLQPPPPLAVCVAGEHVCGEAVWTHSL